MHESVCPDSPLLSLPGAAKQQVQGTDLGLALWALSSWDLDVDCSGGYLTVPFLLCPSFVQSCFPRALSDYSPGSVVQAVGSCPTVASGELYQGQSFSPCSYSSSAVLSSRLEGIQYKSTSWHSKTCSMGTMPAAAFSGSSLSLMSFPLSLEACPVWQQVGGVPSGPDYFQPFAYHLLSQDKAIRPLFKQRYWCTGWDLRTFTRHSNEGGSRYGRRNCFLTW